MTLDRVTGSGGDVGVALEGTYSQFFGFESATVLLRKSTFADNRQADLVNIQAPSFGSLQGSILTDLTNQIDDSSTPTLTTPDR